MRVIVPLVPILILLAGCADQNSTDGELPDGSDGDLPDGSGGDPLPDGEAGDQLPDGTGGENDTPDPGNGFAPQEGHDSAQDPAVPGVVVEGDLIACEAGFCIDARARNDGDATYRTSSMCVSPWADRVEQEGQAIAHRQPTAHCLAFGTQPFAPGDELGSSFAWNATVWDDADASYQPAPGGAHQWIVSFRLYEEHGGAGPHDLEISFTVVVGAT